MTMATVREWDEEEGWGVLDSPETPGGCFAHFGDIEMEGYRSLVPGQRVELDWEAPGFQAGRLRLPGPEGRAAALTA